MLASLALALPISLGALGFRAFWAPVVLVGDGGTP